MENASKALVMAGSILIGVIIMSIMVYTFRSTGDFAGSVEEIMEDNELLKFNRQFEIYSSKSDINWHDILTAINLANDYYNKDNGILVEVCIETPAEVVYAPSSNPVILAEIEQKLSKDMNVKQKYEFGSLEYDSYGRVKKVIFKTVK